MSVTILPGDCLAVMAGLPEASIDAVVTDPPYHLSTIHKRFATTPRTETTERYAVGAYGRHARGFMGKMWDGGDIAFRPETWAAVLRVLKPGGHLVAFGAPKNAHRLTCAIEDAGFEIRDSLMWLFGSGFPKSKNLGDGWGTALKPAYEPIILARKPLDGTNTENMAAHGVAGLNIDGCRVHAPDAQGGAYTVKRLKPGATLNATGGNWRPEEGGVEYHGEMKPGRWPANVVHDGSEEVLAAFPDAPGQQGALTGNEPSPTFSGDVIYGKMKRTMPSTPRGDSGSAARFFYCAKANAKDRNGSKHPTVKPIALMRWLVRMVTPPGGTILDPFAGTGTTGQAALDEGFSALLIEREAEYLADIRRRFGQVVPLAEAMLA